MRITENVYMLESAKMSHVYLIAGKENILIDTGMPGMADRILKELESIGVSPQSIRLILLTHHDVDHIGNAKRLCDETGADLWISAEDEPYAKGLKNRPGIKHAIEILVNPRKPALSGCYTPGQRFGEVRVLSAPGHTPGHTIFQYRDVLFTGDLFRVIRGRISPMPGFMNWNAEEAKKSAALPKSLEFGWLCPAHGSPLRISRGD